MQSEGIKHPLEQGLTIRLNQKIQQSSQLQFMYYTDLIAGCHRLELPFSIKLDQHNQQIFNLDLSSLLQLVQTHKNIENNIGMLQSNYQNKQIANLTSIVTLHNEQYCISLMTAK